jgi:hypothetical protein
MWTQVSSLTFRLPPTNIQLKSKADLDQNMGDADDERSSMNRYGLSKLCDILFSRALQKRLDVEHSMQALSISLQPGAVDSSTSSIPRETSCLLMFHLFIASSRQAISGLSTEKSGIMPHNGALTPLYAAAHSRVWDQKKEYAGAFLIPNGRIGQLNENATREDLAEDLWGISEEIVGPYRA